MLFIDPGAEPAGHNDSRAAVSAPVCRQCGGTHLQSGQSLDSALKCIAATAIRTWR